MYNLLVFRQAQKISAKKGCMMNFNQVKKMAKEMGVNTNRMKKTDIIRAIQKAENNIDCYGTERAVGCMEESCLWRTDCIATWKAGNRT
ncbi:MAG TPA: Rho termination factor N-terminal domain-containing protein [Myxococcota bacterium]|nr:Rho termination factor N-terminal domain-containing protein [Myxococcota bacterium]